MLQKACQGEYPGKPPYGYARKGGKDIYIVELEARFVQKAFDYYSNGDVSLEVLIEKLYNEGIYYSMKQPKIYKSTLSRILRNPFYTGDFIFNNVLYTGKYSAIIDKSIFEKAKLAMRKDNKPESLTKHDFLFGGLMTCKCCGSSIVGDIKKSKYIYYFCSNKTKGCDAKKVYIKEKDIKQVVNEAIQNISLTAEQSDEILIALKDSYVDQKAYNDEQTEKLKKRVEVLKQRISNLYMIN